MPTQPAGTFSTGDVNARIRQLYPDPAVQQQIQRELAAAQRRDAQAKMARAMSGRGSTGFSMGMLGTQYHATLARYGLLQESKNAGIVKTGFGLLMTAVGYGFGSVFGAIGATVGAASGALLANYLLSRDKPALPYLPGGGYGEMPEFEMPGFEMMPMEGQRLDSLMLPDSVYGRAIPLVYGRVRVAGNLIWSSGLIEETEVKTEGGVTITEYEYFVSCAFGFCQGPVAGVRRIWFEERLAYDLDIDLATSLLANGDLEEWTGDDPDDWTVTENGTSTVTKESTTIDPDRAGGAYSAKLATDGSHSKVSIKQDVTLTADPYRFHMRAYCASDATLTVKIGGSITQSVPLQATRWTTWIYPFEGTAASWSIEIASETTDSVSVFVDTLAVAKSTAKIETETPDEVRIHLGSATQVPDPIITAAHDWGSDWVPAYRDLCYIVFKRLPLKAFGNRIPTVRAEIDQGDTRVSDILGDLCERAGLASSDYTATSLATATCQGFFISGESAYASSIDTLRRAFLFDVVDSEGVIKFLDTSSLISSATLTEGELSVRSAGDGPSASVAVERKPEHGLPRQVTVVYLDKDRQCEEGTQIARRTFGASENDTTYRLPVVMTADEARQLADKLLFLAWTERSSFSWRMAGSRLALEPGDVVTLPHAGGTRTARVRTVNMASYGLLEANAVQYDAHVMASSSKGHSGDAGKPLPAGAVAASTDDDWSPADADDLILWYKADAITGLSDGDAVETWADSSDSGHDLTQSTADSRPTYQADELNGKPVVRFDGTDDGLTKASALTVSSTSPYTLAAVIKPATALNTLRMLLDIEDASTRVGFAHTINSSGRVGYTEGGNWRDMGASATGAQLLIFVLDEAGSQLWRNGALVSGSGEYAEVALTAAAIGLGSNKDCGGGYFPGDIAEVCLYSRAISETERTQLTTYMMTKWGL